MASGSVVSTEPGGPGPAQRGTIRQAILEGEAFAVGLVGKVGTVKVLWGGVTEKVRPKDLAARVAHSFGGAVSDRFTQDRLAEIHRRVVGAHLEPPLRRGFEALVDALVPLVTAEDQAGAERLIADLIGAAPDDVVVHVLAVRILALRRSGT